MSDSYTQARDTWRGELTAREHEIAVLISHGLSNDEIAQRLALTTGTVANHVAHILSKLGVKSRVQVAVSMVQQRRSSPHTAAEVLSLLRRLQEVHETDPGGALQSAVEILTSFFAADKADAFLYDPATEKLLAMGTSRTPLGKKQHELGLNELPLSHGGRVGWVFQHGQAFRDGRVQDDFFELSRVRQELGVRSTLAVPFEISPERRGVIVVNSSQPERFGESELQLLGFVAYWVGLVAKPGTARVDGQVHI